MDIEQYREYCLAKLGVTEGTPFGENILVFKVMNKMFALTDIDLFISINLKCDPDRAIKLREEYADIIPGYHMNKVHWNTVTVNGDVSDTLLIELIDHSYDLVVESLPKKIKEEFTNL
ncbi:MAG: putative DNA-binding protein (MmcQ/YjbR family) [Cyclobacteriaceae bacterium]|jgi:predicted DNA-binding protein (MmcQ/YjbR family)